MSAAALASNIDFEALSVKGRDLYESCLKSMLEPEQNGMTVAIHLDSGDYAVARNSPSALRSVRVKRPSGMVMTMIIGPEREDQTLDRMLSRHVPAADVTP
jgi:hypothetical protein